MAAEKLLRTVSLKSPHRSVKGKATFHLAALLKQQAIYVALLREPKERKRIEQFLGTEYAKHLAALELDEIDKERETLYKLILKSYSEIKLGSDTLGDLAKRELFEIRYLSVGKTPPEIEGEDIDGVKFKLSDYRGKVVLLDFWGHW
jgi:hypothetical protein